MWERMAADAESRHNEKRISDEERLRNREMWHDQTFKNLQADHANEKADWERRHRADLENWTNATATALREHR